VRFCVPVWVRTTNRTSLAVATDQAEVNNEVDKAEEGVHVHAVSAAAWIENAVHKKGKTAGTRIRLLSLAEAQIETNLMFPPKIARLHLKFFSLYVIYSPILLISPLLRDIDEKRTSDF